MKPHQLRKIVDQIRFRTGLTVGEIAEKIGYERPYFSSVINNPERNGETIEGRLKAIFPEIVEPMYKVSTMTSTASQVVKPAKDDDIVKRVEAIEKKLAELEAQLQLIVSLLRK